MKTLLTTLLVGIATLGIVFPWNTALAYDPYNPYYTYPPYQQPVTYNPEQAALLQQLLQLIQQLQMQLQNQGGTYYPPVYGGGNYTFYPTDGYNNNSYKEKPEVFMKSVLNDIEGISKISTCKKIEKFDQQS